MLTEKDLIREIKRQRRQIRKHERMDYDFLGFVENEELDKVEKYFKVVTPRGYVFYDWVNGNERLKELIRRLK